MILAHCNHCLRGSSNSSASVSQVGEIWAYKHVPPCPANFFVFFVEMGFHHVAQAGLELLDSSDLPTLASQSAGIEGVSHCTWPEFRRSDYQHGARIGNVFNYKMRKTEGDSSLLSPVPP